jgi:hypothetical protein
VGAEGSRLSFESQRLAGVLDEGGQLLQGLHVPSQTHKQDASALQVGKAANVAKLQRE